MQVSEAKQASLNTDPGVVAGARAVFKMVGVDVIDEPSYAMRQSFDSIKLEELAESIKERGLLQPVVLVVAGERFRISAGHRRTIACRMAGMTIVPAMVFPEGTSDEEAIKTAENRFREDVNPVDEAVYFWNLFENVCGHDIDRVASMTGSTRDHVEGRIDLLQGDEQVLTELQAGRISIGVAKELNKIKDDISRAQGLDFAIKGGATVAVMRNFRQEQERLLAMQNSPGLPGVPTEGAASDLPKGPSAMTCLCCGKDDEAHEIRWIPVHTYCSKAILNPLLARFNGE